jgi:light-regulated signal transduction histidine kinase (bacteriophytochrome)
VSEHRYITPEPTPMEQARPVEPAVSRNEVRQAADRVGQAGAQAVDQARDLAEETRAHSASLAGEMQDRVAASANEGKDGLAARLDDLAGAVHRSGEQLEGHQDWIAKLVESGADELGRLASSLRSNDLQGMLGKLEDLARRQPAVFVGAAMAAGFAAVRLGKVAAAGASRDDLPAMPEAFRERQ